MNSSFVLHAGIMLAGVFIAAVSQVLLKKSALRSHENTVKEYLNPLVIAAYMLFAASTLCTTIAYRVIPMSLGSVLSSTSYIYVTLFGVYIFHEKLNRKKLGALALIVGGVLVFALAG